MENDDSKVEKKSKHLEGRTIALCVTGGIASIETPKLARELRRHGAEVKVYMTEEAQKFIGMAALEWATEQEVITKLSGKAEHICLEDLVLVAPATANTISKISHGIADNAVTTLIASALGQKKPVYIAPAFHKSLGDNPVFVDNLSRLMRYNINIIEPRDEEGKYKLARTQNITAEIIRELSNSPLKGKKVLITAGPTRGKIDAVRYVTNHSSGKLGLEIAQELYLRGAEVKVIYGPGKTTFPAYINKTDVTTSEEMLQETLSELKDKNYDIAIFTAAVLDFEPEKYIDKKTKSGKSMTIKLKPTKKIIKEVDKLGKRLFKVGFKLEYAKSPEDLKNIGFESLIKNNCSLVVANDLTQISHNRHSAYLITPEKGYVPVEDKRAIAEILAEELGRRATATFYTTEIQKPSEETKSYFSQFYKTGKKLSQGGFFPKYGDSSFGNMSVRTEKGFIITSRKSDKSGLGIEDMVEVAAVDHAKKKKFVKGYKKPSSDMLTHEAIYKNFPEVNAIIHAHDELIVEKPEGIPTTETDYPCGCLEAAEEALRTLEKSKSNYIVLKNHGVLALGKDLDEAKRLIFEYRRRKAQE